VLRAEPQLLDGLPLGTTTSEFQLPQPPLNQPKPIVASVPTIAARPWEPPTSNLPLWKRVFLGEKVVGPKRPTNDQSPARLKSAECGTYAHPPPTPFR
jgi:hypothetical protein